MKIVFIILICLIIGYFIPLFFFFPKPKAITRYKYDYILVLGYPNDLSGYPSNIQKKRMECAVKCMELGYSNQMIITGGAVHNQYIEAETMKKLAPEELQDHIILEERAANTFENFKNTAVMIEDVQNKSFLIVTSPSHIKRANFFAKKFFKDYAFIPSNEKTNILKSLKETVQQWNTLFVERRLRKLNKG